jgi:hypothetical protein
LEVHPPHGPAQSLRDFGLQLFTITIGILIALSLEGACDWHHHRQLAREARENIAREIADNKKEVESGVAVLEERVQRIDDALRFANELLTEKKTNVHSLDVGWNLATLNTASWQTAERTGALSFMDYAEVKAYANLYDLQALYAIQQRQAMPHVSAALTALASSGADFGDLSARDLETFRDHLLAMKANVVVEQQLARPLIEAYAKALATGNR